MLFIGGYLLATKMSSTNVESERYSDYFSPMPDISNNNFSKKLKPDNMIGSEFLNVSPGNLQLCLVFCILLVGVVF